MATLVNINNISMWVQADGRLGYNPYTKNWGVIYPRLAAGAVYSDGIVWSGLVRDGQEPLIRAGGSRYKGLQPGRIIARGVAEDPNDPDVRIWRVLKDWQTADLTLDCAESYDVPFESVTQEQIDEMRSQYERDWCEWPWQKGAPFYDTNMNGIMDDGEEPGLAYADQVVWFVANDLEPDETENFLGSPPIGLEMQVTLWAYSHIVPQSDNMLFRFEESIQHTIFKRVRLIYKGCIDTPDTARVDSMYIAQWSDPDIGYYFDDLVGCDTVLNMGFAYNGFDSDTEYSKYNLPPAAIGYCYLFGPIVPSSGNRAFFDMKMKDGFMNLSMTSFGWIKWWDPCGDPGFTYATGTLNWYNWMRGYLPDSDPPQFYPFPPGLKPNKFPLSGDPVTGTGHIDGIGADYSMPPSERRIICSSGSFSMALGDTQEVILAMVGGIGSDRLASVTNMKDHAEWVRCWVQSIFTTGIQDEPIVEDEVIPKDFRLYQNYPNPFNAETEIRYDLPVQKNMKLTIYNLLGQVVRVLVNEKQDAKSYVIKWDGTDVRGEKVPSGIYLYRIEAGYWVLIKKMMLLQ